MINISLWKSDFWRPNNYEVTIALSVKVKMSKVFIKIFMYKNHLPPPDSDAYEVLLFM